jgi:hypothetical protein
MEAGIFFWEEERLREGLDVVVAFFKGGGGVFDLQLLNK